MEELCLSLGITENITYGMLKDMCAIKSFTISLTRAMPDLARMPFTNANSIINVMPVTRSGFTMGSWDMFSIRLLVRLRIAFMPMAAAVPITVATMLDIMAISMVKSSALPASPENRFE